MVDFVGLDVIATPGGPYNVISSLRGHLRPLQPLSEAELQNSLKEVEFEVAYEVKSCREWSI